MSTFVVLAPIISVAITALLTVLNGAITAMDFRQRVKGPEDPRIALIASPKFLKPSEIQAETPLSRKYGITPGLSAEIPLIFANYGDKNGYVRVVDVSLQGKSLHFDTLSENIIVPNQDIGAYDLLVTDMPYLEEKADIRAEIAFEWGGLKKNKKRQKIGEKPEPGLGKFPMIIQY